MTWTVSSGIYVQDDDATDHYSLWNPSKYVEWTGDTLGTGGVNTSVISKTDKLQVYTPDQVSSEANSGGFYGDSTKVAITTSELSSIIWTFDRGVGTSSEVITMDFTSVDWKGYTTVYPTFTLSKYYIGSEDYYMTVGVTDTADSLLFGYAYTVAVGSSVVQTITSSYTEDYIRMRKIEVITI